MTDYPLDIIIPVWNSPIEVRAALASFSSDSPMARLVMVNSGSERETEAILHEFAEALDDRALLLSTGKNIGTVAALNLGLKRSSANFALVTNSFVRLAPGWFDPVKALFDREEDLGAVCIRTGQGAEVEADHGSFSAMIVKRSVFSQTGFFDEQMDGASWALRDFARRVTASGYRTLSAKSSKLKLEKHQELGSQARRQQRERDARQLYIDRWGETSTFLVLAGDTQLGETVDVFRRVLLDAARQGDRISLAVPHGFGKLLARQGFASGHENITLLVLPRFFPDRTLRKAVKKLSGEDAGAIMVSDHETVVCPLKRLSFADFTARLETRKENHYRRSLS